MTTRQKDARQDLAALAAMLDDLAWDLPSGRHQELREHLRTEIGRLAAASPPAAPPARIATRRRVRRPWLILAGGMALAIVAAGAVAISFTYGDRAPSASPGAVRLLSEVADAAAREPALQVRDGQYMYAEFKEASASLPSTLEPYIVSGSLPRRIRDRLHLGKPVTTQLWMPVSNVCRAGLERISRPHGRWDNEPFTARGTGMNCPSIGDLNDATYRLLQTLPTDPHALLAKIYEVEHGHGPSAGQEAFVTIGDLLRDKIVPPRVSAALYRAAGLVPGVTLVPSATDAIGRHGVAVAQTADGIRTELIFSKKSLKLIGERTIVASISITTDVTAIISQGFADHIGQVPPVR